MSTETQTAPPSPPEITILNRVYSIPLIGSSIDTITSTLSNNAYTSSPYATAKGLSTTAYNYSVPLQTRLAPLIVRADGYANKAVDVVESRYPYPFKAKPEEVADYVRQRRHSSEAYVKERRDTAYKTLDDNVTSPAATYAAAIDQRFAPVVDYFETTVTRLNPDSPPSVDSKYQYQRALALSKNLKDNLLVYSNDQFKQLQQQNALVQRATETATSITNLASSSIQTAQTRVQTLSDTMVADLKKLSASLSSEFSDLNATLTGIITDLRTTLKSDLPLNEKATRVGEDVKERISPVLESVRLRVTEIVGSLAKKGEEVVHGAKEEAHGATNGSA